jgi:adenylyltransferase/sulfurtransferase
MALTTRDRTRYARQLLLPQIGEAGQLRLLAARVREPLQADAGALSVACSYLARAGLRTTSDAEAPELSLVSSREVARLAGDPALIEAARALAGALAAVDALRAVAGFDGRAQTVIPTLSVTAEDA